MKVPKLQLFFTLSLLASSVLLPVSSAWATSYTLIKGVRGLVAEPSSAPSVIGSSSLVFTANDTTFPLISYGNWSPSIKSTLSNVGSEPAEGIQIYYWSTTLSSYHVSSTCGRTLGAGRSCDVFISWTPSSHSPSKVDELRLSVTAVGWSTNKSYTNEAAPNPYIGACTADISYYKGGYAQPVKKFTITNSSITDYYYADVGPYYYLSCWDDLTRSGWGGGNGGPIPRLSPMTSCDVYVMEGLTCQGQSDTSCLPSEKVNVTNFHASICKHKASLIYQPEVFDPAVHCENPNTPMVVDVPLNTCN